MMSVERDSSCTVKNHLLEDNTAVKKICCSESYTWHRGKLPFEIPNFASKIGKFATFCRKNCQLLRIKFTNRIFFFRPRTPRILH